MTTNTTGGKASPSPATTATVEPSQTPEPPTPTPTPIPLAATVNGEPITLAEYQAELGRFEAAQTITGTNLVTDSSMLVLNELIDQVLFAQGAAESGFIVDDAMLQSREKTLEDQLGSKQVLEEWKAEQGYSDDDFTQALRRSISVTWMRDKVIASVPDTVEEVHVRQILLPTAAEANSVYAELQSGTDFIELAAQYDPATEGDLGWFPRGYLTQSAIEEAAFALQPDQYSQVIETDIGFHILYLIEKDPNHTLQPEAKRALQLKALQDWIKERRSQSEIKILLP